jgi:hypothetical protein
VAASLAKRNTLAVVENAVALMEVAPGGVALTLLCGAYVARKDWAKARTALARLAIVRPRYAARVRRALEAIPRGSGADGLFESGPEKSYRRRFFAAGEGGFLGRFAASAVARSKDRLGAGEKDEWRPAMRNSESVGQSDGRGSDSEFRGSEGRGPFDW